MWTDNDNPVMAVDRTSIVDGQTKHVVVVGVDGYWLVLLLLVDCGYCGIGIIVIVIGGTLLLLVIVIVFIIVVVGNCYINDM
jgi:hypothetical protein